MVQNSGSIYLQEGPLSTGSYFADTDFDRIDGEIAADEFGSSVSVAGDINGDGVPEITVGASGASMGYVIDGTSFTTGIFTSGLVLSGPASSYFGGSVSTGGDVDGDGYDDLFIGASEKSGSTGSAYLIYGDQQ